MRITIVVMGSRGDVQPCVALGLGLQQAGHKVCIAAQTNFKELIQGRGLNFSPLAGDAIELMKVIVNAGHSVWLCIRNLRSYFKPIMEKGLDDIWKACHEADVIIGATWAMPAQFVAEKLGLPYFRASVQPFNRTRSFPTPMSTLNPRLGAAFNYLTHVIAEQVIHQSFRGVLNKWRGNLGLPPLSLFQSSYDKINGKETPVLYGYSPSVIPKPPDWGENLHVVGYWFLDSPHSWQPPTELTEFLSSGPPPVYVGFGSMPLENLEELKDVVVEALDRVGHRAILCTGWSDFADIDLPTNIFRIDTAPHDWLFPRMLAVVHHGGAGTVGTALRAGVPSVIIPPIAENSFWGRRAHELGVGAPPIPPNQLTVERLATAIRLAIGNESMRERAAKIGERIRCEDGVGKAVEVFHEHMSTL
jgi:sterol 3beta-glucosyltransferase